jgi:hypothetical protein
MGDKAMSLFGVLNNEDESAINAVRAAIEMQKNLVSLKGNLWKNGNVMNLKLLKFD